MQPPIDLSILSASCGGNMAIIGSALRLFVTTTRADLVTLEIAMEERNAKATNAGAHRIKGAARIIGGTDIIIHSQSIEDGAEAGSPDWQSLRTELARLAQAFGVIDTHITTTYPG